MREAIAEDFEDIEAVILSDLLREPNAADTESLR
jgi:hypothetical protein